MVDGGIPYPMLSDQTGEIGRLYGVYDEESGTNIRGRFLIDPDGIIQAAEVLSPPVGRITRNCLDRLKRFSITEIPEKCCRPAGRKAARP